MQKLNRQITCNWAMAEIIVTMFGVEAFRLIRVTRFQNKFVHYHEML